VRPSGSARSIRPRAPFALVAALLTLVGAVGAPAAQGQMPPPGQASEGDFAGRVSLSDGRRLYLECHGAGGPTVIFEAGLRSRGDIWTWSVAGGIGTGVLPRVVPRTRACIYDRPGTLLGLDGYNLYYLQSPSPEASQYEDLEAIDFYLSFAEMRRKPRPPHRMPIVVLSREWGFGAPPGVSRGFARLVNRIWKRAQAKLASLEPGVKHLTAFGSGHQINVRRPGLVARMVGRVVAAVRR
jgi:hypothetical protein